MGKEGDATRPIFFLKTSRIFTIVDGAEPASSQSRTTVWMSVRLKPMSCSLQIQYTRATSSGPYRRNPPSVREGGCSADVVTRLVDGTRYVRIDATSATDLTSLLTQNFSAIQGLSRRSVRTDTPNSAASLRTLSVSPATRRLIISDSLTASRS